MRDSRHLKPLYLITFLCMVIPMPLEACNFCEIEPCNIAVTAV